MGKLNVHIILGCVTEVDVDYYGNDNHTVYLPDVPTCRSACRNNGTDYFTFSFYGGGINLCYCKNSDSGAVAKSGRESGKTSCSGESKGPFCAGNVIQWQSDHLFPLN